MTDDCGLRTEDYRAEPCPTLSFSLINCLQLALAPVLLGDNFFLAECRRMTTDG